MRMVDGGWQERPHREEQLLFHDIHLDTTLFIWRGLFFNHMQRLAPCSLSFSSFIKVRHWHCCLRKKIKSDHCIN